MQIASEGCAWVGVITVSELDDGSSPATVESVRLVAKRHLARGGLIFLWSSTPCTGVGRLGSIFWLLLEEMIIGEDVRHVIGHCTAS